MEDLLIPIFGIVFVFGSPVVIVALALAAYNRKRALMHETINKMVDSGQPVPADMIAAFEANKPGNHLKAGALLLATGLGLAFFLTVLTGPKIASVAALPLFLGVAFLILHKLDKPSAQANG